MDNETETTEITTQPTQPQVPDIPKANAKSLQTYTSLNPRQQLLIHLLVTTDPPQPEYQIYQLVYPDTNDNTARANVSRTLAKAKAKTALREYQQYHWSTQIATLQEVQATRSDIMRHSDNESNRLTAARDISRTAGYDVQGDSTTNTQINIINMPGFQPKDTADDADDNDPIDI